MADRKRWALTARMVRNFPFVAIVVGRGNNRQPAFLLSDGFPPGFLGDLNAPVNTVADLPADSVVRNWSTDFPLTQVYQWNFSAQRQLATDLAATAVYVGSSTTGIMYEYNINGPGRGDPNTEAQRRVYFPSLNALSYRSPAAHASYHGLDLMLTKRFRRDCRSLRPTPGREAWGRLPSNSWRATKSPHRTSIVFRASAGRTRTTCGIGL